MVNRVKTFVHRLILFPDILNDLVSFSNRASVRILYYLQNSMKMYRKTADFRGRDSLGHTQRLERFMRY